jgi:2-polyprenyl-3-methyl-5-hydroxy-6-metoxy-1,4-benzoquinol methylase
MSNENKRAASPKNSGSGLSRSSGDAEDYAEGLESDYGFEAECVRARFNFLLRHLRRINPKRILEVGCGVDLFIDAVDKAGVGFERWVVIEPASVFAQKARNRATTEPRLLVVEGYCEDPDVGKAVRELGPFDVVLLSGVLQDVDDPAKLLRLSLAAAAPGAHVLVTTPNALSFHRLLAVEMGLLPNPHAFSPRNLRFRQSVVFDSESLRKLLEEGGVRSLQFEGYLFKPFTHAQMARVLELLPSGVCEGLDRLGQKYPEHGAEIAYCGVKG